jgi:hypothetical protein
LLVANRENQEVVVIDPGTRKPVARLQFADGGQAVHRILIEGDRIYLADQSAVYEIDGRALVRELTARDPEIAPLRIALKVRND